MRCVPLLAALVAATLMAPDRAAGYAMLGNGTMPCDAWTTARGTSNAATYEQWVVGFLSGIGFMVLGELDPLRGLDAGVVHGWVDKYCREHPRETIEAAARVFIQEHPR